MTQASSPYAHTPSGRYPLDKEVSEAIAAQLGSIGITVHVQVDEWRDFLNKVINRTAGDMYFFGAGPDLEPLDVIAQIFAPTQTYSNFGDPTIDEMLTKASTIVNPDASNAAYRKIQEALHPLAPWVPLWQQHDLYGVANWVSWQPRADEKLWMWEASAK